MQFYAVLPLLLIVTPVKKRTLYILVLTGLLMTFPLFNLLIKQRIVELIYGQRYFNLLLGVVLGLNYKHLSKLKFKKPVVPFITQSRIFKALIVSVLIYLLWSVPGLTIQAGVDPSVFASKWGFLFAGLISTVLVYLASRQEGYVYNFPILDRILAYIGSRSYAIYLCHFHFVRLRPTMLTLFDKQLPAWFKTAAAGLTLQYSLIWIGMIVCSEIVYRLIEKPFVSLGKGYITHTYLEKHEGRTTII